MGRYKIKLPTDEAFAEALNVVEGQVPLYVRSEKRRTLSVGELPALIERRLRALGGEVTAVQRYEIEEPASV
jgi:uroporphyrinogen-III synthase